MAEVASKKSINVVSSKKNSEACSVQSNNGLIDLDNITSCSNNQLITLSDDDLLLTNNTKNDINVDDKSLQELIESELALRISSSTSDMDNGDEPEFQTIGYIEETEVPRSHPEITKIVLEPRPNPQDVNSEFIIAEMNHYNATEERYVHQNGHHVTASDSNSTVQKSGSSDLLDDTNKPEKLTDRNGSAKAEFAQSDNGVEQTIITENSGQSNAGGIQDIFETDVTNSTESGNLGERQTSQILDDQIHQDNVDGDSSRLISTMDLVRLDQTERKVSSTDSTSQSADGISLRAEDSESKKSDDHSLLSFGQTESKDSCDQIFETSSKTTELLDTWSNPESSTDTIQIGQFSDNFDESLQQIEDPIQLGSDAEALVSQNQDEIVVDFPVDLGVLETNAAKNFADQSTDIQGTVKSEESDFLGDSSQEVPNILDSKDQDLCKIVQTSIEPVLITTTSSKVSEPELKLTHEISSNQETLQENNEAVEDAVKIAGESDNLEEVTSTSKNLTIKSEGIDDFGNTSSFDISSTRDFINSERQDVQETLQQIGKENVERIGNSLYQEESTLQNTEVPDLITTESTRNEDSCDVTKSKETISTVEIIQTTEKTTSSNETPRVFSQSKYADHCFVETPGEGQDFESWTTVEQATTVPSIIETTEEDGLVHQMISNESNSAITNPSDDWTQVDLQQLAPLATPDDEISDVSNKCDLHIENREEVITTTSVVTSSTTSAKSAKTTKTKKKKIEGVANSDASPGLTPRIKKTKKSKKSDPEKENISVKSSFNKFDALSKKPVLHVRSVDTGKVQQQFNSVGQNGEPNPNCRSCGKVVFQMEQTKAEGLIWHKNCFRCNQCSKQLSLDNYQSHEATLYCKAHFKELFQPKPVEESDQPMRPRKPEMIIRENQPTELPPDVVRASDKPDLGLEELSALNVKSRFQVFEKTGVETNDIERSPSQVAVKRSPSILSKLAKFQAKGMDIGVADESLNGIPFEESSESEEEEEDTDEVDTEIIKAKRSTRERPMSFSKMDDMKNRWESTSQQGRRESQREARKEEIAGIRSRLFMGKQGKMKEMYQQAVAESERVTKINAAEEIQEIQQTAHARSIKERFERGDPIAANEDENPEDKYKHQDRADEEVIAAGISKKSRSLFLELDATAAKTARPVTPVTPKTPAESTRRARDAFVGRQVSDDVIRSTDTAEEVRAQTSDISNKFKFFEAYKAPEKQRRQFRITPPRDGQVKMESPEREIYRDPEVVRADDRVDEVVHTDTARKMLSIFRQMEENASKEDLPDGPKPLKRFTPPPEDKFAKPTASESEDEEDEEGEESEAGESGDERDPNYVRASDKVEDEFLKQAQTAARAKTLRAKFEHWETTDDKVTNHNVAEMEIAQGAGDQSSIESASSLRARFESLGSQPSEAPRTAKVKVNRFVEIQTTCAEVCESCEKKVYPLEKVETNNKIFHKQCFRCLQCNCILRMDTFTLNNGKLYCIPHFKQLFITRGNYDEGFGINPHKNKWASSNSGSPAMPITSNTPTQIAVSNGDL